jgi:hypothetical protein
VFALIHHTSLFEPVFIGALPNALLWEIAQRFVYPVAEETLKKPLIGKLFRMLSPKTVSVTRSRDHTWNQFVSFSQGDSLIGIAPEGRMKRLSGLDRNGKPMSIRAGIADILQEIPSGMMILLYSKGLHHIQSPGSGLPRVFKTVGATFEVLDISKFKNQLGHAQRNTQQFVSAVIADLESRKNRHCV